MTNILITGGSSGIGAALAIHYAAPDVRLFLTGRNKARLAEVGTICTEKGAQVTTACLDVTDRHAMKAFIEQADHQTPLDLVIANAGISGGTGETNSGVKGIEPDAQIRDIFAVNLDGVMNTIDPILPRMVSRQAGQIALMSSLAAFSGWPGAPAYSASKGAVRLYGEALRETVRPHGVRINVICPGFIKTPMTDVNDYKMPFMISAERAAQIISRNLARNKGRIAFPVATYLVAGLVGILPYGIHSLVVRKTPQKKALPE